MATTHAVIIYSGTLSSSGVGVDGTLTGTKAWETGSLFTWTVTEEPGTGWNYSYTLIVEDKELSHITTEVSDTFLAANILGGVIVGDGNYELKSIDESNSQYGPSTSNPGIPGSMSGIKMDINVNVTEFTWSFSSDRVPEWGDMYAKDGKTDGEEVYLYNDGFNNLGLNGVDTDPINPAGNGSVENHILVPDTDDIITPPEPSTSMLGALGLIMMLRRRNR